MVLIQVCPQPDPTKLHHEVLKRMNQRPYLLRFQDVTDGFIPTKEEAEAIGAAIAQKVMDELYPAGMDQVGTYDIVGTHLGILQVRPVVNPEDYDQFCFYYKLEWESDHEGHVTVNACPVEEANVTVHCRVLRIGELPEFHGPLQITWEEDNEIKLVDSYLV